MNKRFGGMVGIALMGLVVIGLGAAVFLETHLPDGRSAAAPQTERGPRVAFSGDTAALASLFSGLVSGQAACADITFNVQVSPNPAGPNSNFQLLTSASVAADGTPLRVNSAGYYFNKDKITAFHNWQADATKPKPSPDAFVANAIPKPGLAALDPVTGSIATAGKYDLIVEISVMSQDTTRDLSCVLEFAQYIDISEPKAANFTAGSLIINTAGLLPLQDWVPLYGLTLQYDASNPAPRALTRLRFRITTDPKGMDVRNYLQTNAPTEDNFLEFALIPVNAGMGKVPASVAIGVYDGLGTFGQPAFTWDAHGYPYELPVDASAQDLKAGVIQGPGGNFFQVNDCVYDLSFVADPSSAGFPLNELDNYSGFSSAVPKIPFNKWLVAGAGTDGNNYVLAVRLSSTWQTGTTMSFQLLGAVMQPYYRDLATGQYKLLPVPFNQSGTVDKYSPDFFKGKTLVPDTAYSASFGVFDMQSGVDLPRHFNQWNEQLFTYTPVAQFARPRWDLLPQTIQFVMGEMMDMRQLFSVETWTPVLGMDLHSGTGTGDITLLNMVMTDVGGDPFAPPGNGGFDPRSGLEKLTDGITAQSSVSSAVDQDYAFNGLWVWHDTNGNGKFDAPTPQGTRGVTFTDYPMYPLFFNTWTEEIQNGDPGIMKWHYEPFPPGGGDPWWKIQLTMGGGRRRNPDDTPTGYFSATPDSWGGGNGYLPKMNYFVVMRADSGFADVSGQQGDGVGINLGATIRAFVEPRRWNPRSGGHWSGGMLLSDQSVVVHANYNRFHDPSYDLLSTVFFQDSKAWDIVCDPEEYPCGRFGTDANNPNKVEALREYSWWPQRTHNQDVVKPLRCGAEVHDLALTYATDNRYSKITPIMVGQVLYYFFPLDEIFPMPNLPSIYDKYPSGRSTSSIWLDPAFIDPGLLTGGGLTTGYSYLYPANRSLSSAFASADFDRFYGLQELNFFIRNNPWIYPDIIYNARGTDEVETTQYAFETVPFALLADQYDPALREPRSSYWPSPYAQPTLPRYSTWSAYQNKGAIINWGEQSRCYLAGDGGNNTPYSVPGTSDTEKNYADDVYVFVCDDPKLGGIAANLKGKWLVDSHGGRYEIVSNAGGALTLRNGHGAYLGEGTDIANYPFGVPVGIAGAVARGHWMIVEDTLQRGTYPRIDDWRPDALKDPAKAWAARLLRQYIEPDSMPTAMLGVNLCGTDDPAVLTYSPISLNGLTVAFWGPDFDPSQLAGLDPNGELFAAGVTLYEDSNANGVFDGPQFGLGSTTPSFRDRIVPLEPATLNWSDAPEPVNLYGEVAADGQHFKADDVSGDGVVFLGDPKNAADVAKLTPAELAQWDGLSDLCWVLDMRPRGKWTIPYRDGESVINVAKSVEQDAGASGDWPSYWLKKPELLSIAEREKAAPKALVPTAANPGDDLFVVIRTSKDLKSFSEFRTMVPTKLPGRSAEQTQAGIQLSPRAYSVVDTATKRSPEEGPVQDFYGHDTMIANVFTKVYDLTPQMILVPAAGPVIQPGGAEVAILGADCSANRPENIAAQGAGVQAQSGANTFTVAEADVTAPADSIYYIKGQGWTSDTVGLYLIGYSKGDIGNSRIEGYEITAAAGGRQLTLRTGAPRPDKPWFVVKDPTFLEQTVVEFYDYNRSGNFDLQNDLLPLNYEDPISGQYSGVALYRDNDASPKNRNGVFDPPIRDANGNVTEYVDLPVKLDAPPILIGTVGGEPEYQVKFVFSSPGTDNRIGRDTVPYETQANNRQWVPQTTGLGPNDPDYGADFFVVVRPSNKMALGDRFQAGIVSWGPNTPTEPDPDNFTVSILPNQIPGEKEDEFKIFSEFPWGARGVGYITLFKEALPVYSWGFDKVTRKPVPRRDVDRSQLGADFAALRNWTRTNPWAFGVTQPITSLAPPQLDFVAEPTRQLVNTDVNFRLLGVTQVASVLWEFGDGATSVEVNPTHRYAATGLYTVKVTVVSQFGIRNSASKTDYIEIIDAPFADFTADPVRGSITPGAPSPALTVTFTDGSVGGDTCSASAWSWNFGDGTTSTLQNPAHRYTEPGIYTVTLETTFQCSNGLSVKQRKRDNYITVLPCVGCTSTEGETTTTTAPKATIKFSTLVKDKEGIVPLSDWVQLFRFTMSYDKDPKNAAPRILRSMRFYVCPDSRLTTALGYVNHGAPFPTDLLEFSVFKEGPVCKDCAVPVWGPTDGVLDPYYDDLQFKWDNLGAPAGKITAVQELSGIVYTMDFVGQSPHTSQNPQFLLEAKATSDAYPDGNAYIVAVRSSATWRSQLTMGVQVWDAQMIEPSTGAFPVDDKGKPIDSYEPNFYDAKILEDKQYYGSSFGVYDFTGSPAGGQPGVTESANAWNYPKMLYMPLGEFTRPRWNAVGQTLQVVAGNLLQLRTLTPIDDWRQAIGINVHSTRSVHFEQDNWDPRGPQLREVNVVLTDIGGDPYGPPGNGGFNPRDGLKPLTTETWGVPIIDNEVFARDVTYNGIWVWYDANNNGSFDPPTMNANGGITFNGDYPMLPSAIEMIGEPKPSWEYIPLPLGGGDPWWKISMRFIDGDRKVSNVLNNGASKEGFIEAVPDNHGSYTIDSEWSPDYFVVIRTDSGYKDVSLAEGDGGGIAMGADFRAFIEPRRLDPVKGTSAGGILIDSMIPAQGIPGSGASLTPWQNDSRWLEHEPWWPQRTMNQNTSKPLKVGVEVHDLTLTYQSRSQYRVTTDLFYQMSIDLNNLGQLDYSTITIGGYSPIGGGPLTGFDQWLDPFGLEQAKFQNGHTVDVTTWRLFGQATVPFGGFSASITYNETETYGQYAYETVPFFNNDADNGDAPPAGPRSTAYPTPPQQPTLPTYASWSTQLKPGEYPRASQWTPENSKARLLTQKTEANSFHAAMLGINLIGDADPYVNNAGGPMTVSQVCVAFWGPDFTPDALKPLDPDNNNNQSLESGVLLWEDTDLNGVFLNTQELSALQDGAGALPLLDQIVPVTNAAWSTSPELVDINGDGKTDDMNGDGVVDDADRAWVLTFFPKANWVVPQKDGSAFSVSITGKSAAGDEAGKKTGAHSLELNGTMNGAGTSAKALDPAVLQPGDDLFITVSTSDKMRRFQKFRAVVPATLPTRAEENRKAGIQFYPQVNSSATAFVKGNPDEDPVQDFYGWDMLESNVPLHLVDMTNRHADIDIGGGAIPVIGIDAASNRPEGTVASGNGGIGLASGFRVPGVVWTTDQYKGDWLVDSGYETYEITGNVADELTLLSGTPRNGTWRVVRDPSFLEEVQVELYAEKDGGSFNPVTDLLPLDIDQRISGIALYRDNDNHPDNRNGIFDPDIDIPVALDAPPRFSGQTAEDIQVKFVFSTPGTDDFPLPKAAQTRHRQWVQDTFGATISDTDYGPDFFVVARAAQGMQVGDKLRVGIVSWGPNTPTEPDPDTWANLPGEDRNDLVKFREFPWADRGVGFVTFFRDPQKRYFMDGALAGARDDNSGFNWLRSHSSKKRRTGLIEGRVRPVGPTSLVIEDASERQLPSQTLPGESFPLVIYGSHFGSAPVVVMSGYDVGVNSVSDTAISINIGTRAGVVPQEPVVLLVRNPASGEETSRSDLFTIVTGSALRRPAIVGVDPSKGTRDVFPVHVYGENFGKSENTQVKFGQTLMPVLEVSADGASITVGFPTGGLPDPGKLDVTVRDTSKNLEDVMLGGFEYQNQAVKKKFFGLLACSGGDGAAAGWTDLTVLLAAAGALFAARRRGTARAR